MTWTQPICVEHWNEHYSDPDGGLGRPRVMNPAYDHMGSGEAELCCYCNKLTYCGLYVRIDPTTVPYPAKE